MKLAVIAGLMMISVSASATEKLSAAECHLYPFAPVKGELTHRDVMRELSELESVGYQPAENDPHYPDDITRAEKALHAKFVADCSPTTQASDTAPVGKSS
ncbi:DUF4148 domain-containing protein [Paraburkholderia sp. SIMBA_030]|uniref:DUF4148 domain-containing protein n=1 Tax=Paraburkholderia sp. SIMBA_030 TaxID=3085773 RepID=UPI00397C9D6B